jgi:hypothetical protein
MQNDPLEFCKELSLCAADNVPYVVRMAVRWLAARTDGAVRVGSSTHAHPVQANDVVCDECQFVVNQLRSIMGEKSTQDQVRQVFDGVCQYLGGTTAQKVSACQSRVDCAVRSNRRSIFPAHLGRAGRVDGRLARTVHRFGVVPESCRAPDTHAKVMIDV